MLDFWRHGPKSASTTFSALLMSRQEQLPDQNEDWSIDGLDPAVALERIGHLIDVAFDARDRASTDRAAELLDHLQRLDVPADVGALAHYFRANIWHSRQTFGSAHTVWDWEQPELQEQILELRRAAYHPGFTDLHDIRRCQILTNLANQLDTVGRFIEAIETWDEALAIEPRFAKAAGNRGVGFKHYGHALYDDGHAKLHMVEAFDSLTRAIAADAVYESGDREGVVGVYERQKEDIQRLVPIDAVRSSADMHGYSLGRSAKERRYRQWCLEERLYINPLNDLGPVPIAAHDVLTLPSLTTTGPSSRMPKVISFFNQMKQEFVSARFLFYDGWRCRSEGHGHHFSDRGVLLYNTLDYPAYGLSVEKMRAAFRIAYSIFDKIGFFINAYMKLGIRDQAVNFRSVWYGGKAAVPLLSQFEAHQNWPMRGLLWLSKDIHDKAFKAVPAPEAKALAEIRNHLEHRYLHLRDEGFSHAHPSIDRASDDALSGYELAEDDFARHTVRLLKRARAALIYLSLAVTREEEIRRRPAGDCIVMQMPLDHWEDRWKG